MVVCYGTHKLYTSGTHTHTTTCTLLHTHTKHMHTTHTHSYENEIEKPTQHNLELLYHLTLFTPPGMRLENMLYNKIEDTVYHRLDKPRPTRTAPHEQLGTELNSIGSTVFTGSAVGEQHSCDLIWMW